MGLLTRSLHRAILSYAYRISEVSLNPSRTNPLTGNHKLNMARKKATRKKATKKKATRATKARGRRTTKKTSTDLIISKSRTKAAAGINVSGDFYGALDEAVRGLIATAEARAEQNNRRTLRPHDL